MVLACKFAVSSSERTVPGPGGPEIGSRFATHGLPSLEPHVILDGHHALDAARDWIALLMSSLE